jgi:hypothetical protein
MLAMTATAAKAKERGSRQVQIIRKTRTARNYPQIPVSGIRITS